VERNIKENDMLGVIEDVQTQELVRIEGPEIVHQIIKY